MKLRNKKTGEIMDDAQYRNYSLSDGFGFCMNGKEWEYHSLAEFNEEWEDYEEPKEYWFISDMGQVHKFGEYFGEVVVDEKREAIGNYFETKEEAEQAVEKLKAWKRLKDKGFEFEGYDDGYKHNFNSGHIEFYVENDGGVLKDLDLLFGGDD